MEKNKIASSIKYLVLSIKSWIKQNPWDALILFLILVVGAFFRLYKIDQYMTFLGDEGRDAIIVRRLLVLRDPILIGPGTSIGNMYLGPLYYYMMAPALFLAGYSPVGPAVQIAILGVITIFMVWYFAHKWFGKWAAVIAAALYAISPTIIIYSRSSWNPNIMPFFSLLCIYSIWKVWQENKFNWLIVLGISYAFVLQSHYLGLLLAPTIFLFWLLTYFKIRNSKFEIRNYTKKSLLSLGIFLCLMSPLVIFDIRHGGRNFSAIYKFFSERQTTVSIRPWTAIPKAWPIITKINTRLVSGQNVLAGKIITGLVVGAFIFMLYLNKKSKKPLLHIPYYLLLAWLGFAIIGLGLYKQEIYDHYYGFFFAAPFLLFGGLAQFYIQKYKKAGFIVSIVVLLLIILNLKENPLRRSPNRLLERSQKIAAKIEEESGGKPFNLAVLAERNYEDGYQYFLEKDNYPVIDIDAQKLDKTITNQLFVVCEMAKEKCDPTHSPKAEVANFGWSKIESEWEIMGITIYKLVHTK
jgi:4-amino-4-deoxy-L-arabinose transferase-like glycosyltransferase